MNQIQQLVHTHQDRVKLIKYGFVGASAFTTEFLVFSVLMSTAPLLISQSVSFGTGLVVSFLGNRFITFKSGNYTHSTRHQFFSYFTLACVNLLLTNIIIYTQVHYLGILPLPAKIITMAFVVVWNFLFFQRYIFKST